MNRQIDEKVHSVQRSQKFLERQIGYLDDAIQQLRNKPGFGGPPVPSSKELLDELAALEPNAPAHAPVSFAPRTPALLQLNPILKRDPPPPAPVAAAGTRGTTPSLKQPSTLSPEPMARARSTSPRTGAQAKAMPPLDMSAAHGEAAGEEQQPQGLTTPHKTVVARILTANECAKREAVRARRAAAMAAMAEHNERMHSGATQSPTPTPAALSTRKGGPPSARPSTSRFGATPALGGGAPPGGARVRFQEA